MSGITRRTLFKRTSAGVAALGALAAVGHGLSSPGAEAAQTTHGTAAGALTPAASARTAVEPIIAHVRDYATGEIAIFAGTREIVVHDTALVSRLLQAGA
jgi:hypothetical protein